MTDQPTDQFTEQHPEPQPAPEPRTLSAWELIDMEWAEQGEAPMCM